MTDDQLIIPPPSTLGVWADVRPLEDYPDVQQKRGPAPRAVLACRKAVLAWGSKAMPDRALPGTSKHIRELVVAAATLMARRSHIFCDPFDPAPPSVEAAAHQPPRRRPKTRPAPAPAPVPPAPLPEPKPAPAATPGPVQTQASNVPQDVPQDEFMAALAAVFG